MEQQEMEIKLWRETFLDESRTEGLVINTEREPRSVELFEEGILVRS